MRPPAEHWTRLVRDAIAGRRWICTGDAAPPVAHMARQLHALGAEATLCIAAGRGVGEVELPAGTALHLLPQAAASFMESIHAAEAALADLPPAVQAAVDAWDPTGEARVVGPLFAQATQVAGRSLLGGRPPAWRALEDKTVIDAVWDAVGVPRARSAVVPLAQAAAATPALATPGGVVWAADNRSGWHGGGAGTRRVRTAAEAEAVTRDWADRVDRVRVMPFLEGVPCSIHGLVSADHVLAGRPMEMVVLRRPEGFLYFRAASYWDPPAADRAALRATTRAVGAHLRQTVGYRGVFTIDGVMTAAGFRPTELNPRFGAAANLLLGALDLPLYLLHLRVADGQDRDLRPAALEALLLEQADAHRSGRTGGPLPVPCPEERREDLVWEGAWRPAGDDEAPHATANWWPFLAGSMLNLRLHPAGTPVGPPVAPRVAGLIRWLDDRWQMGLGPVEGARAVR